MTHYRFKHEMPVDIPVVSRNGWAVVYAGFIIMLLCFFVLLCAYSVTDRLKVSEAVRSFSTTFNQRAVKHSLTAQSRGTTSPRSRNDTAIDAHTDKLYRSIRKMAAALGMEHDVHAAVSGKGVILQMSNSILFGPGQADVLPEGRKLIAHVSDIMVSHPLYDLRIEGHTDNTPIHTDRYPSNWELSTSRAVNVLRCFMNLRLIDAARLSAVGFGEFNPRFPDDTPEHRAQNRRVELFFFRNDIKKVVQ